MSGRLFDRYVIVDWSAASRPTTGRDSIWIGIHSGGSTTVENIATRAGALARLRDYAADALAAGERVLMGFDFPFGYPAGVARHLTGRPCARALWQWLADRLADGPDNANNRFEIASDINRRYTGTGPFWGRPGTWDFPDIPITATERRGTGHPPERRLADSRAKGAKTVWQLAYAGAVGSQVLTGLPALLALRNDPDLAAHLTIWPFDTGLETPTAPVVLAEIYPSLIPPDRSETVKDAGQVRAVADWMAGLDAVGTLPPLFAGPPDATERERHLIATEEAWILGLEAAVPKYRARHDAPAAAPPRLRYQRDPAEIYRHSFAMVEAEARLDHLPADLRPLAVRLVHACGMPEVTARLAWSADVARVATDALADGGPILCDCQAVASMVIRRHLPRDTRVLCTLDHPETTDRARQIANTRSAAAVELWRADIAGAVVAIGNAPTALFHLLELIDQGWPKPAAILGFPVGFVGAAESKAELAANPRGIPFMTLRGRRGGSAMAAAAVNALAVVAAPA